MSARKTRLNFSSPMNKGSSRPEPCHLKDLAQHLKAMGRMGDTDLVHVNEAEKKMLKLNGGSGTINPKTGLREYGRERDRSRHKEHKTHKKHRRSDSDDSSEQHYNHTIKKKDKKTPSGTRLHNEDRIDEIKELSHKGQDFADKHFVFSDVKNFSNKDYDRIQGDLKKKNKERLEKDPRGGQTSFGVDRQHLKGMHKILTNNRVQRYFGENADAEPYVEYQTPNNFPVRKLKFFDKKHEKTFRDNARNKWRDYNGAGFSDDDNLFYGRPLTDKKEDPNQLNNSKIWETRKEESNGLRFDKGRSEISTPHTRVNLRSAGKVFPPVHVRESSKWVTGSDNQDRKELLDFRTQYEKNNSSKLKKNDFVYRLNTDQNPKKSPSINRLSVSSASSTPSSRSSDYEDKLKRLKDRKRK